MITKEKNGDFFYYQRPVMLTLETEVTNVFQDMLHNLCSIPLVTYLIRSLVTNNKTIL
jgi:hypothetical protein